MEFTWNVVQMDRLTSDGFVVTVHYTVNAVDGVKYKNINHETLIPTLVKAIQEQQAMIENLTTRLNVLENK